MPQTQEYSRATTDLSRSHVATLSVPAVAVLTFSHSPLPCYYRYLSIIVNGLLVLWYVGRCSLRVEPVHPLESQFDPWFHGIILTLFRPRQAVQQAHPAVARENRLRQEKGPRTQGPPLLQKPGPWQGAHGLKAFTAANYLRGISMRNPGRLGSSSQIRSFLLAGGA